MDWIAVETQAVYFSGTNIWDDIRPYLDTPDKLHYPAGNRRPDYRSSGAKRLAPQLSAKSPVMRTWGRKVVVVVDESFFDSLTKLDKTADDFDNAEVIWLIMRFNDQMNLVVDRVVLAELGPSIDVLQSTERMNRADFEAGLRQSLWDKKSTKVHDA